MFLKDFVRKFTFTQPTVTVTALDEFEKKETMPLHEIVVPQTETIPTAAIIDMKDLRIKSLENQIKLLKEKLSQVETSTNKPVTVKIKKYSKLVDVIAAVFSNAEKDLNANEVLKRMDKRNLKNKNPSIESVRATLYYLKELGELIYGANKGTFVIKRK